MRYLVTPSFSKAVVNSIPAIHVVASFLKFVETSSREEIIENKSVSYLGFEGSDILQYRSDGSRILFSFGSDDDGDYVLIVDLIVESSALESASSGDVFARNDPTRDPRLNPLKNNALNPRFNNMINPRFNSNINPKFNSSINPRFNSALNPRFNSAINPRFNSSINPRFNSSINPRFNATINPRRNTALGGPFVYNLNLAKVGYLVKANSEVSIVYDMNASDWKYAVSDRRKGFLLYDQRNNWIEYWIYTEVGVLNRFDLDGQWIGFVL